MPTPKGNFKTLLRIYWPGDDVLGGDWTPPPLTRDTSSWQQAMRSTKV